MEYKLQTILSITTGILHGTYTDLGNAICKITGVTYYSIGLVMVGVPKTCEHIYKHFPQFEGFPRIDFPKGENPTYEQLETVRIQLGLPSQMVKIPTMEALPTIKNPLASEIALIRDINPNCSIVNTVKVPEDVPDVVEG